MACRLGGGCWSWPLGVVPILAYNPLCWEGLYSPETCCPPHLDPVGNIECWWDHGLEEQVFTYTACCNDTGEIWAQAQHVFRTLMMRATSLPNFKANLIVMFLASVGLLPSRYAVNIGAADGTESGGDPVVPLFVGEGFAGLAVEPDPAMAAKLRQNMPPAVRIVAAAATPANVAQLLHEAAAPAAPALLKVDIDSYDCAVLFAALQVIRPALVQVEVNAEVPYPLVFGVHYSPEFKVSGQIGRPHAQFSRGFSGCSARLAAELAMPFGYDAVGLAGAHDLLFMRRDIREAVLAQGEEYQFLGYELSAVARGVSVGNMRDYFGVGVGAMWLFVAETRPEDLLRLVRNGIDLSCRASQGQWMQFDGSISCRSDYTLGLDADEFRRHYV